MFTENQIALLKRPLDQSAIKKRSQSGREFSYIEGWYAVDRANKIFGFDGWDCSTVEMRLLTEKERTDKPGWKVTYFAKVEIIVRAGDSIITRQGSGAGHGIDKDLGQAHESALKEAETDAMKRAIKSFGDQFGLCLYDKTYKPESPSETAAENARYGMDNGLSKEELVDICRDNNLPATSSQFKTMAQAASFGDLIEAAISAKSKAIA